MSRTASHCVVVVDLDDEALELLHMPARQPPTLHKLIDRAGAALDAHVAHLGPRLSEEMGEVAAAASLAVAVVVVWRVRRREGVARSQNHHSKRYHHHRSVPSDASDGDTLRSTASAY